MAVTTASTITPPPTCDKKLAVVQTTRIAERNAQSRNHEYRFVIRRSHNCRLAISSQAITGPYVSKLAGDWSRRTKMRTWFVASHEYSLAAWIMSRTAKLCESRTKGH